MSVKVEQMPRAFAWRRLHSLTGLWFLIFLCEHLFTNSQAALFFEGNGMWFVRSVNFLRELPYLQVIELILLGVPIVYHTVWGIWITFKGRSNSRSSDGSKPSLKLGRNRAYTWQRITAWILLLGIILHVVQMRFLDYPYQYRQGTKNVYYARFKVDPGLYGVANRLDVKLYDNNAIEMEKANFARMAPKEVVVENRLKEVEQEKSESPLSYNSELDSIYQYKLSYSMMEQHVKGLESRKIREDEVMGVSTSFGSLELINVRESFQSITMCILYTIFVAAAAFHGCNGLWTFLITWGVILSRRSHSKAVTACVGLMFVLGLLGMMSIWGTFFLNMGN